MTNSVDPDQTAPIGAVCSWSTLFASILNSSVILGNYLQQTTSADDIFRRFKNIHLLLCVLDRHRFRTVTDTHICPPQQYPRTWTRTPTRIMSPYYIRFNIFHQKLFHFSALCFCITILAHPFRTLTRIMSLYRMSTSFAKS